MIGGEDHHGIVQVAVALECFQDVAHLTIDHGHVGQIVGALPMAQLGRGILNVHHRVVVDLSIVAAHDLERGRLVVKVRLRDRCDRQILLQVGLHGFRGRIVGRMGAGETDLQEQGLFGPGLAVQPPGRQVADEIVGVHVRRQLPVESSQAAFVVLPLSVQDPLLLGQAPCPQGLVPFVEPVAFLQEAVLVLHHVPFVKAQRRVVRPRVHLADVDAAVAAGRQVLDPGVFPVVRVAMDAGGVGILPGEETGPGGGARRRAHEAVGKDGPLLRHPIQMRRVHVGKAERGDGVVALLIRDDQNDVGAIGGHPRRSLPG